MTNFDKVSYSELESAKLSVEFEPDVAELAEARRLAGGFFEGLGCRRDLVECAQLITSELATNSIHHAATTFTVTCETLIDSSSNRLGRISVEDGAPDSVPVLAETDRRAIGGRGLSLVARLGAGWGVELTDTTKTVWCELELDE